MAKIIEFKKFAKEVAIANEVKNEVDGLEDDINYILNDYSLTPANRRWMLENMLMDVDEQLEKYKKDLEQAERKMEKLVMAAEREIAAAYNEFNSHVLELTHSVKKLTKSASCQVQRVRADEVDADSTDLLTNH